MYSVNQCISQNNRSVGRSRKELRSTFWVTNGPKQDENGPIVVVIVQNFPKRTVKSAENIPKLTVEHKNKCTGVNAGCKHAPSCFTCRLLHHDYAPIVHLAWNDAGLSTDDIACPFVQTKELSQQKG